MLISITDNDYLSETTLSRLFKLAVDVEENIKMKLLTHLLPILLVVSGHIIRRLRPFIRDKVMSKVKQQLTALDDAANCDEEHISFSQHDMLLSTMGQTAYMLQQYQR